MSDKPIVFVCSLPGAGGMLLQSILAQNPLLRPLGHSPIFEMVHGVSSLADQLMPPDLGEAQEFVFSSLHGLLSGASDYADQQLLIDKTGTGPLEYLDLLKKISPQSKVILFVRDLRDQLAGLQLKSLTTEYGYFLKSGGMFGEKVLNRLLSNPILSIGLDRIVSFLKKDRLSEIFVVSYEQLCLAPQATLLMLYEFLQLEHYKHSFSDLQPIPKADCFSKIPAAATIRPLLRRSPLYWPHIFTPDLTELLMSRYREYFSVLYPDILTANPFRVRIGAETRILKGIQE